MIAYVRNLDIISTYLLFNIVQQSLRDNAVTRHIALDSVTVFVFISVDSADVMISHNATNLFSSNHFLLLIIEYVVIIAHLGKESSSCFILYILTALSFTFIATSTFSIIVVGYFFCVGASVWRLGFSLLASFA